MARKIGLGRTDWRSGRMFTSRSYLRGQPTPASPRCADRTSTAGPAAAPARRRGPPARRSVPSCAARPVTQRLRPHAADSDAGPQPGHGSSSARSARRSPRRRTARCRRRPPHRRSRADPSGGSQYAAPTMTVPVSSRISGTRRAWPCRARRAAPRSAHVGDLDVEPVGAQQPVSTAARSASEPTTTTRRQSVTSSQVDDRQAAQRTGHRRPPNSNTATSRRPSKLRPRHPTVVNAAPRGSAGIGWVTGCTAVLRQISGRICHAGNRAHRRPVGRRGQRKGHRSARWPRAVGRALPGRQQRRPHRGAADGRELRAAPDPVGHPDARASPTSSATASSSIPGCCSPS